MLATVVNGLAIILGGILGALFGSKINERYTDTIFRGLGLITAVLGIINAIKTADVLGMIVCLSLGVLIGEALDIEGKTEALGRRLEKKAVKNGDGRFAQGFVAGSLLFCIGSMAIMGALEAGIHNNPDIILSKAVIDGIAAVTMAAGLGPGVACSGISVLLYQGTLTLFSSLLAPFLSEAVVLEMTAVGGILLIGVALNILDLGKHLRVANMLPAIFLPLAYQPLVALLTRLF